MPPSLAAALPTRLSPPDLALVALYLIGITLFGLRFSQSSRAKSTQSASLKSYFLADNTIPWWAIALSIVSAETSTLTIISIPGVAFAGDLGFLQIVLGYMLGRIVVALLFLPRYFRGEMLTAYQLIEQRFGSTLHKLTAGLFLITRAAAEGVRVFAISIVVTLAIGTGDILSIALISALTLLYTFEGGMAAVIWTDVVQMVLYLVGTLAAIFTLGFHVPGGWSHIHAAAEPLGKFHMLNFAFNLTTTYTFWAGILGGTFLTMASHGTDQLMVQRMLAARNLRESRLALLSSGAVIFLQFTLFLLIGVGLFVFYGLHPQVFASSDRIFPSFIVQQMPRGIAGLLVAAILAAAMSNLSAALNSLASTTVIDFYVPFRNRKGALTQATGTNRISRLATVLWALVLFAIAVYSVQHGGKGHVVETGLSIASVAYGCLLGVFLLGTLTRYATQTGAILGMICGLALNLTLWLLPAYGTSGLTYTTPSATHYIPWPHIAFTWYVLIGSLATFALGSLFSLILPKPRRTLTAAALLFCLSSFAAGGGPAFSQTPTSAPDFTPASTLISEAIAQHKLPGAVLLVGHNGKVVFEQAYGLRKLPNEPGPTGQPSPAEPMTLDTIFDMASLTKVLVTSTAILQLYEQRKLDLDSPVATYLPAFASLSLPNPSVEAIPPSTNDPIIPSQRRAPELPRPNLQALAWKSRITIRQLLTHYSGLPEDVSLKEDWGLKSPDKAEGIRRALTAIPYGPPGQTFKYSDINFITLGFLVEVVSGEDLDAYAQNHIFDPLQINHSRYLPASKACSVQTYESAEDYKANPGLHHPVLAKESCPLSYWYFRDWVTNTAPTAHDNEGTPATNPDFDHLLRGTVHDPTTRRMGGVAGHAGLFSTAADLSLFCQALLDKLTRNEGPFPLTQATLEQATSPQAPTTAHTDATIFTPDGQPTKGVAQRGLGWDLNSPFSRPRGEIFPLTTAGHPGSFGHTGFTGTSLWLDPTSNTYVILLANAIHPRGNPPISALRGQVATAIARALNLAPPLATTEVIPTEALQPHRDAQRRDPRVSSLPLLVPVSAPIHPEPSAQASLPPPPTLTGIDVLEATNFAALKTLPGIHTGPLRIGLLTNQSGLDRQGRRTIDILAHASKAIPEDLQLKTIFTPEHGLHAAQDTDHLTAETDTTTHLPVISVYGPKLSDKHPRQSDLKQLDAVLIDLPDAGVPFWTYETVTGYFLESCAKAHIPVVILDRPNPLGGLAVQGPTADPGRESYLNFTPIPIRHGLTLGELARYFNAYAVQTPLDPTLLDARSVVIGTPGGDQSGAEPKAPATQPGLHAQLTVIPMQNWTRAEFFTDTGLIWTPPSPNMRTPATNIVYPGVAFMDFTNMSVGRGSPAPYENFGAAFLNAPELASYLNARKIPGINFTPTTLTIAETPEHYPFHGQTIPGIHLTVTDRTLLDSPEMGIELLSALHHLYPAQFQLDKAKTILLNADTLEALKHERDPRDIAGRWRRSIDSFEQNRRPYLLYH